MESPLRIVVVGSSVTYMVVPDEQGRGGRPYGEQLRRLLQAGGVVADVRYSSQWFGMVDDCRRDLYAAVLNQIPDVLIVHYGTNECQPQILPNWYYRHFAGWNRSGYALAVWWHAYALFAVWPALRRLQRTGSRRTGQLTWRMRPERFVQEMTTVISAARTECDSLVLVIDIDEPGARLDHWIPGLSPRRARFQDEIAKLAATLDASLGGVRLITGSVDVTPEKTDALLPDGLHRTAAGHALLARRLSEAIVTQA